MNQRRLNLLLSVFMICLNCYAPERLWAQTFTTLYHFTRGSDGASPNSGLILSGSMLYGTAYTGGNAGQGTIFKIATNGTGFTALHSFAGGGDGANPNAGLVLQSNTLYGTTVYRGTSSAGTVFKVNENGTGFTNVFSFAGAEGGANPLGGMIILSNVLYGTACHSSPGAGTAFALNTDGSGFTNLYNFTGQNDGGNPKAGLTLVNNSLFGTTANGGLWSGGTVFSMNTDGTEFDTLYSFSGGDGATPSAELILSGNTFYGTTAYGGIQGAGTVFSISTDGPTFTSLYNFTGAIDGANPAAGLILSGNTLYGTTTSGGTWGNGTIFAINTDGSGFRVLHHFTATVGTFLTNSDGAHPVAGLVMLGNTLYGSASAGGKWGDGTLFSLTVPVPPQLTITSSGTDVILTWPTNFTGYKLQSATNLVSPTIWATVSPTPVIVNGLNTVTNPGNFGTKQFFRLSQ